MVTKDIQDKLQLAVSSHQNSNIEHAKFLYREIIEDDPESAHAHHNLAVILDSEGLQDEALVHLGKAVTSDPSSMQFWVSKFNLLIKQKEWRLFYGCLKEFSCYHSDIKIFNQFLSENILLSLIKVIEKHECIWVLNFLSTKLTRAEVMTTVSALENNLENQAIVKKASEFINPLDGIAIDKQLPRIERMLKQKKFRELIQYIDEIYYPGHVNEKQYLEKKSKAAISLGQYHDAKLTCLFGVNNSQESVELLNMLAICYASEGNFRDAEASWKRSLELDPSNEKTYFNLGKMYEKKANIDSATKCYEEAIKVNPEYIEAIVSMAFIQHKAGVIIQAIRNYKRCLELKPDLHKVALHLASIYLENGALEDASQLISNVEGNDESYLYFHTLGNLKYRLKEYRTAIGALSKAFSMAPKKAEILINLAMCHSMLGEHDSAAEYLVQSLTIQPKLIAAWDALPLISGNASKNVRANELSRLKKICKSTIDQGRFASLIVTMEDFGMDHGQTNVPTKIKPVGSTQPLPVFTLYNFGRSGTGLLHSLIDGHEQVITTPSIFFSDFFRPENLFTFLSSGFEGICDKVFENYPVFFDARRPEPINTIGSSPIFNFGQKEGLINLGVEKSEVFTVDQDMFKASFYEYLKGDREISLADIFWAIHFAYDNTKFPGLFSQRKALFYHIHNPSKYAEMNFNSQIVSTALLLVREPLRSLESWIFSSFSGDTPNYAKIVSRISGILRHVSAPAYRSLPSFGIKLEDIKNSPDKSLTKLSDLMGIKYVDSMHEMSVGGSQWWGDPASPNYDTEGMNPFGKEAINRDLGSVFSKNDLVFFETLLHPFKTHFGYELEYTGKVLNRNDLNFLKIQKGQLLDFEKKIASKLNVSENDFSQSGYFAFLRHVFNYRLEQLNTHSSYPDMVVPL